jgi:hypothetical protein
MPPKKKARKNLLHPPAPPPAPPVPKAVDNSKLWMDEVQRVGLEFSKKAGQWQRIMSVIRLTCKHLEYDEDNQIGMLMPINSQKKDRERPESVGWNIKEVMKFSIKGGTIGVAYNTMKQEYERIKGLSDKRLGKSDVTVGLKPMAKWRDLGEAWQQGAAYVCAFWKVHPEMSKEEAYNDAVELAKKEYRNIDSGKQIIIDLMNQRRLKLTHEEVENEIMHAAKVPFPKWLKSTKKENWERKRPTHTDYLVCTTNARQAEMNDAIRNYLDARRASHGAQPIVDLRNWATNYDNTDGGNHPDDNERLTADVLKVWKKFLTREESDSPPLRKPSKAKQMALSKGFPMDGHFEYIGRGEQFHSERHMSRYLKKAGLYRLFWNSKIFKAYRLKKNEEGTGTPRTFEKSVLSFLDVYSYHKPVPARTKKQKKTHPTTNCECSHCKIAATDTEEEEEEEEYETPVVSKIVYRWKLPEAQGHALVESLFKTKLPNLSKIEGLEDTNSENLIEKIKDKYEEQFGNSKHFKSLLEYHEKSLKVLEEFDFEPATFVNNINKNGRVWKRSYLDIFEYAGYYHKIELEVKSLEKELVKIMDKASNMHPVLIKETPDGSIQFHKPGENFAYGRNYIMGNLIAMDNAIHAHYKKELQQPIPQTHCMMLAMDALGMHQASMGTTLQHYQKGMATWLKPHFSKNIDSALQMIHDVATMYEKMENGEYNAAQIEKIQPFRDSVDLVRKKQFQRNAKDWFARAINLIRTKYREERAAEAANALQDLHAGPMAPHIPGARADAGEKTAKDDDQSAPNGGEEASQDDQPAPNAKDDQSAPNGGEEASQDDQPAPNAKDDQSAPNGGEEASQDDQPAPNGDTAVNQQSTSNDGNTSAAVNGDTAAHSTDGASEPVAVETVNETE